MNIRTRTAGCVKREKTRKERRSVLAFFRRCEVSLDQMVEHVPFVALNREHAELEEELRRRVPQRAAAADRSSSARRSSASRPSGRPRCGAGALRRRRVRHRGAHAAAAAAGIGRGDEVHRPGPHLHRLRPGGRARGRRPGASATSSPGPGCIDRDAAAAVDRPAHRGDPGRPPLRADVRHATRSARSPAAQASRSLEDAAQAHGAEHRRAAGGVARARGRLLVLPEQEPRGARRRRGDLHERRRRSPSGRAGCATSASGARASTSSSASTSASTACRRRCCAVKLPHLGGRATRPAPRARRALPRRGSTAASGCSRSARRRRASTTSSRSASPDRDALGSAPARGGHRDAASTTRRRCTDSRRCAGRVIAPRGDSPRAEAWAAEELSLPDVARAATRRRSRPSPTSCLEALRRAGRRPAARAAGRRRMPEPDGRAPARRRRRGRPGLLGAEPAPRARRRRRRRRPLDLRPGRRSASRRFGRRYPGRPPDHRASDDVLADPEVDAVIIATPVVHPLRARPPPASPPASTRSSRSRSPRRRRSRTS